MAMALSLVPFVDAGAQTGSSAYRLAEPWAKLPGGRKMSAVGKLVAAPDGNSIWAVIRCAPPDEPAVHAPKSAPKLFGYECRDSDLDPVVQFDLDGNVIRSFGGGLFIWPHGMAIDPEGNIWVTDAAASRNIPPGDRRGHQVIKFSPDGKVLLRIGTGGVAGAGRDHLTSPSDITFAKNGDALIADGHYEDGNNRIVRFSAQGAYVSEWGRKGYAPGEFRAIHTIATDEAGRIYVGDRGNNRIQIFKPDGTYVTSWLQFGRPSGIFIKGDAIYVADSESDNVENPGFEMGIRIGELSTGWVKDFIPYPWGDPNIVLGTGAEFVTVDRNGNIYGGEPVPRNIQKYVRVRP
jgi:DNA-binding beta-propeller fold protein YncE